MHLKDGKNKTVEIFINTAKNIGDLEKFVNAAHTSNYYKGALTTKSIAFWKN